VPSGQPIGGLDELAPAAEAIAAIAR